MFDDLKMASRYAWDLRGFLQTPLSPAVCRQQLQTQLQNRDIIFLQLLQRAVYQNPTSPYRALLQWAEISYDQLAQLVSQLGIEAALQQLYEAGVYVTLDEFKGRRPIERPGFYRETKSTDFDNPLMKKHFEARTGGTRSKGTRLLIDLDMLTYETAYFYFFLETFNLIGCPTAIWRPAPPGSAGMKNLLRLTKLGQLVERWFVQNKVEFAPENFKYDLFTYYAVYASRVWGKPLPKPDYTPVTEAAKVAQWLAAKKKQGRPAYIDLSASSGVRVCLAAREHGLDISGTFFRVGGEPFTQAKAQVFAESGCRTITHYAMSEVGRLGMGCATPTALDDVHLLHDKVSVIQVDKAVGQNGDVVQALFVTSLHVSSPKLLLNLESGDCGVLEQRECGCPFGALGFHWHLHTIRSYEKLTSGGMTFLGSTLLGLIEEVLPARFGGHPTDYQFVEDEVGGIPQVSLVVNPKVGEVDETQLLETVLNHLGSKSGGERMMATYWADGKTIRILRREPYLTSSAKIQTLHTLQKK